MRTLNILLLGCNAFMYVLRTRTDRTTDRFHYYQFVLDRRNRANEVKRPRVRILFLQHEAYKCYVRGGFCLHGALVQHITSDRRVRR